MLRRAVERGVSVERLAKALNVDTSLIHKKVSLLDGICPEAVEMLKDQHFPAGLGSVLRRMKPTRQVECVELMLTANNMTIAYAEALFAATPAHLVAGEKRARKLPGVTAEQMVKMEREMGNLQGQLKVVEKSYGQDVLLLVLARGKALFSTVQPACALCHTLKAAASSGQVGPNLDELQPDADRVLRAVREGLGVMPSFEGQLTEQDMRALAAFVAHSSGAAR